MLSCMETQLGLTIIGPNGQSLRLQRNNPAYQDGRAILQKDLPAEQAWLRLQAVVANPLKSLVGWCERFGLTFKEEGETLKLNDVSLNRETWLPLLVRTQSVCASPKHILQFAELLGSEAAQANVSRITLHLRSVTPHVFRPALLMKVNLPPATRTGDIVTPSSAGSEPYLVSVPEFSVKDGGFLLREGTVLSKITNEKDSDDILSQPAVLGFNRTYRCEEGTADGWLEDLSFDSLKAARCNAKEIQDSGSEVRIVNRITGEVVPML